MDPTRRTQQCLLMTIGIYLALMGIASAKPTFGLVEHSLRRELLLQTKYRNGNQLNLLKLLRGGSTTGVSHEEDDKLNGEEEVENADENEDDKEMTEEESRLASAMSSEPVSITIQTNWGNSVLDHRVELMAARTRNVATLKKSLSRLLPGRPPILGLELVYEGRILDDEMLVDELFDEDDEEEEDNNNGTPNKTLILNALPPVDPKFATELVPKLKDHVEDDEDTLTTEELIDAYYLNQAAMARNSQLLADPNTPSSPLLRLEVQELAKKLREQLRSQTPDDVWEASLEPVRKSHNTEERRGQRYRSGKGGARTNLKKSIQHNLNINWGETIRNCFLFLFFGYFGGRNTISRYLMLWGAPLCFILQARPVKMWSKILFYMMANPPSIVLSLLPAPQQAILSFDMEKSYSALYNPGEETKATNTARRLSAEKEEKATDDEEEDEDESDVEEEESETEDESETEEESEDEYESEEED